MAELSQAQTSLMHKEERLRQVGASPHEALTVPQLADLECDFLVEQGSNSSNAPPPSEGCQTRVLDAATLDNVEEIMSEQFQRCEPHCAYILYT